MSDTQTTPENTGTPTPQEQAAKEQVPQEQASKEKAPKEKASKQEAPKRTPRSRQPEVFLYESREREPSAFSIAGVDPERDFSNGRLIFKVKQEKLLAFQSHYHVATGRVVRKHDGG